MTTLWEGGGIRNSGKKQIKIESVGVTTKEKKLYREGKKKL